MAPLLAERGPLDGRRARGRRKACAKYRTAEPEQPLRPARTCAPVGELSARRLNCAVQAVPFTRPLHASPSRVPFTPASRYSDGDCRASQLPRQARTFGITAASGWTSTWGTSRKSHRPTLGTMFPILRTGGPQTRGCEKGSCLQKMRLSRLRQRSPPFPMCFSGRIGAERCARDDHPPVPLWRCFK